MSIWIYDGGGQPFSDSALLAEIAAMRAALRKLAMGGDVGVVAGEGRRVEFTKADTRTLNTAISDLLAEAQNRGLAIGDAAGAGSIQVVFP